MEKVKNLIENAKNRYPMSVYYKGRFTENERKELEKFCDVKCASVYMNGTGTYSIRYRKTTVLVGGEHAQFSTVFKEYLRDTSSNKPVVRVEREI